MDKRGVFVRSMGAQKCQAPYRKLWNHSGRDLEFQTCSQEHIEDGSNGFGFPSTMSCGKHGWMWVKIADQNASFNAKDRNMCGLSMLNVITQVGKSLSFCSGLLGVAAFVDQLFSREYGMQHFTEKN
jgi:hypothetical protein